ncbi:Beta-hexosaminidase [Symmachiella dynata]|uniref:glycoside hydrolase family 20 zincin-like fold domain-containing protein n=1 Tax=Symmachiella dynata TaxID=2527995 RepID=UPI00118979AA|nr:glycoside hydrolase family 20 zincin-like fold domain-containing protein [Symmachiella dynata]QDT50284.1 Beta-hexosaminidase [Symmachiella dynata]
MRNRSPQKWVVWITLVIGLTAAGRTHAAENFGILPTPQNIESQTGSFTINRETQLVLGKDATAAERFAAEDLRTALQEIYGFQLPLGAPGATRPNSIVIGKPDTNRLVSKLMQEHGLSFSSKTKEQGYVLGISDQGIVIAAENEPGLLYGTMSLRQIAQVQGAEKPLPAVRIHDWPHVKMRGVQEETAYGQASTMKNYKAIIRFIAHYKMNTYFIYLEDNYRFKKYPSIGVGRGAFDADQINELEAYAKQYHIELIPIFEMLGNQGTLLMNEEVLPFSEYPGSHSFATDDAAFEFLESCFLELIDVFDSKYFHAGLDESWDLGFGKTEVAVKKDGRGLVHAQHYRRLNKLFKDHDKTMIMYGDVIVNRKDPSVILNAIPKDIVLMDWVYGPKQHYDSVDKLAAHDFPLMVLPGLNNWSRIFPTTSAALINIRNFTLDGIRHNALGSFTSTWGDFGSKNLREMNYFGYAYGAEVTWSPQSTDVESFYNRFFTLHNGPGTATPLRAVFALLEKWPFGLPIVDYFRHPFAPRYEYGGRKPDASKTGHSEQDLWRVREDARVAEALIAALRPVITRRKGDLDYYEYCARMHRNYVRGQLLVRSLRDFAASDPSPEQIAAAKQRFAREAREVRDETLALRNTFQELWLRTNQPDNLQFAVDEYDMLIKAWDETATRAEAGVFAFDSRPASQWIYHPHGFEKQEQVQHASFRKTFEVDPQDIELAGIQVQGDTHVKLFVNGKLIGEQFARRNFSAPVNPHLLELYDIKPYLEPGKNVIAVEAHAYGTENRQLEPGGPERCGGFHLYGELIGKNGQVTPIFSDSSWKVSDKPGDDWTSTGYDDANWPSAQGDEKPTVWISYPDFRTGQKGFSDQR